MKQMTGPMLDRVRLVFKLTWGGERFTIDGEGRSAFLTPDELAELSRELLRAAVTKDMARRAILACRLSTIK
jgi:hypothetical protein